MRPFAILAGLVAVLLVIALQACGLTSQPAQPLAVVAPQRDEGVAPVALSASTAASRVEEPAGKTAVAPALPEAWPSELFFVRNTGDAQGEMTAYDMSTGRARFKLPPGIPSPDGKHYYAAQPTETGTLLRIYELGTGRHEKRVAFDGLWALTGVSWSGRWVAMTRVPGEDEQQAWAKTKTWKTDIQILDTASGQAAHTLTLDGNFEVETISPSGDALFLIEHLPAVNPNHYLIRLFDLRIESLVPGALRDKSATDEVMAGLAWDGLASPNGRWLLTLYLSTLRNTAFVHTLDLSDKYPVCIDLPSGSGDFNQLKYYSLALAPSGWRLFAANAVLGVVAEISLSSRSVTRRATFQPRSFGAANASNPQSQLSRSVVSKDGSKLYFTSGLDVWVYDTASGEVDGPFLINGRISALGLSGDGKRLYVAAEKQPLLVFDTQSGLALNFPQAN